MRRWAWWVPAAVVLAAAGCKPPPDVTVPAQDPTPPSAVWLQADVPGQPLVNTTLAGSPATGEMSDSSRVTVSARADDPDGGVRQLRIWVTTTRRMPGSQQGPSLAGTPAAEFVSPATVGQPARPSASVSWSFDVEPLIGPFWDVTLDVFAEAENFHGGRSRTAVLSLHVRRVGLRLRVIALSDADGGHAPQVTPAQFADAVRRANRAFRGTGIRLAFDPASDFETRRDTDMNQDRTIFAEGNQLAAATQGRILVLLRWGGDPANATGNGNAFPPPGAGPAPANVTDVDQRYVALPSLYPTSGFSFLTLGNGSFMAHEFGHYLGLYHTFPGWDGVNPVFGASAATGAAADQAVADYAVANGGTIDAFDGDRLPDTAPDPGVLLYQRRGQDPCTTPQLTVTATSGATPVSLTFDPPVTNAMSYYALCTTGADPQPNGFTRQQAQRMHATLSHAARAHLLTPP